MNKYDKNFVRILNRCYQIIRHDEDMLKDGYKEDVTNIYRSFNSNHEYGNLSFIADVTKIIYVVKSYGYYTGGR